MHISHTSVRITLFDHVSNRVHQVRLAQAYTPVQKERVVGMPGVLGHLISSGTRELIALAFHERAEREVSVDRRPYDDPFCATGLAWDPRRQHRHQRAGRYGIAVT